MSNGWYGYDRQRIATLRHRIWSAADELARLAGAGTGAGADAERTIAGVATGITAKLQPWLHVLDRITLDTSMVAWPTAARPGPPEDPTGAARWWDSLDVAEQRRVIDSDPAAIGNLDGVPAWARDVANRDLLAADLQRLSARHASGTLTDLEAAVLDNALATQQALVAASDFVDPAGAAVPVQLYVYEPAAFDGDGRGAIAVGDLDTADHVAVCVPGLGTELSHIGTSVQQLIYTDVRESYDVTVAVLAYPAYDAPSIEVPSGAGIVDTLGELADALSVVTPGRARDGAGLLAADVSGLEMMRGESFHLCVIGNSYGSTVVAIAADELGLAADDVVLTGSPGAGPARTADDLVTGADHTWVASASNDPVTYLGDTGGPDPLDLVVPLELLAGTRFGLGNDPAEDDFGARRVRAESSTRGSGRWTLQAHQQYYDHDSESGENIASIVAGEYDDVELAEPRHKREDLGVIDSLVAVATVDVGALLPDDPEARRRPAGAPLD